MEPSSDYVDQELERRLRAFEESAVDDPARRDLGVPDAVALTAIVLVVIVLSLLWGLS